MTTGVNPGVHGIFDFFRIENYERHLVGTADVKAPHIWDTLSDLGKKVIVVNHPSIFPAYPINGVMISGMMTPSYESKFVYPPSVKSWLMERDYKFGVVLDVGGRSSFARAFTMTKNSKSISRMIERFNEVEEKRGDITLELMDENPDWDFVFVLFESGDRLSHYFWSDSQHDILLRHYRKLDEIVGKFLARADENTWIGIASDHGFTSVQKKFFINSLLMDMDLLAVNSSSGKIKGRLVEAARWLISKASSLGVPVERILSTDFAIDAFRRLYRPFSDYGRSQAFMINETAQGIWINVRGREQQGTVAPEEYDVVRGRILDKLNALTDPATGKKFITAYPREQVFKGKQTRNAVDIVCTVRDGYSIECLSKRPDDKLREANYLLEVREGEKDADHHPLGVYMSNSPITTPREEFWIGSVHHEIANFLSLNEPKGT